MVFQPLDHMEPPAMARGLARLRLSPLTTKLALSMEELADDVRVELQGHAGSRVGLVQGARAPRPADADAHPQQLSSGLVAHLAPRASRPRDPRFRPDAAGLVVVVVVVVAAERWSPALVAGGVGYGRREGASVGRMVDVGTPDAAVAALGV